MDRKLLLIKITGGLFLAVGLFALFCVPAEFSSFYMFTQGGACQFEGFGFGSLLFAFILASAMIYTALAATCIPVGIGNIKRANWGRIVSRALWMAVLAFGVALVFCMGLSFHLCVLLGAAQYIILMLLLVIALVILPYLTLRFYNNPKTIQLFNSSQNTYFENQSERKIALILLNMVWVMFFSTMILLKGAFPFFGRFIFETAGTYSLSAAIFTLLVLSCLYYRNIRFAKYALLILYGFVGLSVVVTFLTVPLINFIHLLRLPAYEMHEMASLLNIVSGVNPGFFFAALLIIQILLLLRGNMLHKISNG